MAIGDRIDRAWLAALRARLEAEPTRVELARRRAWVRAMKQARVKVDDFDAVATIGGMRDRPANVSESEYTDQS